MRLRSILASILFIAVGACDDHQEPLDESCDSPDLGAQSCTAATTYRPPRWPGSLGDVASATAEVTALRAIDDGTFDLMVTIDSVELAATLAADPGLEVGDSLTARHDPLGWALLDETEALRVFLGGNLSSEGRVLRTDDGAPENVSLGGVPAALELSCRGRTPHTSPEFCPPVEIAFYDLRVGDALIERGSGAATVLADGRTVAVHVEEIANRESTSPCSAECGDLWLPTIDASLVVIPTP